MLSIFVERSDEGRLAMRTRSGPRVCVDARIPAGHCGGIEHFITGLVRGLTELEDGDEEYVLLTLPDDSDWITSIAGSRATVLTSPWPHLGGRPAALAEAVGRHAPGLARALSLVRLGVPSSSGVLERAKVDVVHFTQQEAFRTNVSSIYHPHDLQHRHLPEFFSPRDRVLRESRYRFFCNQATVVAVASAWTKRDLIQSYHLSPSKIEVIPLAPAIAAAAQPSPEDLSSVRSRYQLPPEYLFYPAQTWPHKNHLRLVEALWWLREREGVELPLICSGTLNAHRAVIARRVSELGLENLVKFTGFVDSVTLQCLYRLSTAVVIPTLFEAGSFPMWDAFLSRVPVACSTVTALPDQAGGAAILFSPTSVMEIAQALLRLHREPELRRTLVERGQARVAALSWERTARHFRALYRQLAGKGMTEEDRGLMQG